MSRSATISSMNAERDRAAAAQQQAAANAGQMPDEPERDWSQGGKLRYTLGNIPIVTTLTLLTCLAIWCWELSDDSVPSRNSICWIPVVEWGEWHRVLSSAFLHASAIHILMNMYVVFTIGAAVEHQLGSLVMLGLVVLIVPLQNLLYVRHTVALCLLPLFSSR
jgi:membrane associated rhomboid family serine protease